MYRICAVAAVVVLAACGQSEETPTESVSLGSISLSEQATTDLQTYATKASAFVQSFDAGADDATLSAQAQALMDLSETIVPEYVEVYPGCKEHLNAALKITETWQDLDPETIERDYHQDAALPDPAPGADCYHMKDLVVHPATALALLLLTVKCCIRTICRCHLRRETCLVTRSPLGISTMTVIPILLLGCPVILQPLMIRVTRPVW